MSSNATSPTAETTTANGRSGRVALRLLAANKSLIGLILLMAAVSLFSPNFLTIDNLMNILRQTSVNAVIAMGMTFVILTAGIDLSVGSILAFTGAVCASLVAADASLWVALPATLALAPRWAPPTVWLLPWAACNRLSQHWSA